MKVDTFIAEYEKMTGEKVNSEVRHFVEALFHIEEKFQAKGGDDGAKGLPAPSAQAFTHWANKVFDDDTGLAASVADLMRMAYMHGYREGGDCR